MLRYLPHTTGRSAGRCRLCLDRRAAIDRRKSPRRRLRQLLRRCCLPAAASLSRLPGLPGGRAAQAGGKAPAVRRVERAAGLDRGRSRRRLHRLRRQLPQPGKAGALEAGLRFRKRELADKSTEGLAHLVRSARSSPGRWSIRTARATGSSPAITNRYSRAAGRKRAATAHPVFGPPEDMIVVDLAELYPELKHLRLRGRLEGRKLIPYYSRAEWTPQESKRSPEALLWIDDADRSLLHADPGFGPGAARRRQPRAPELRRPERPPVSLHRPLADRQAAN
jgi:hypothetical protein